MGIIDARHGRVDDAEGRQLRRFVATGQLDRIRPGVFDAETGAEPTEKHRRLIVATADMLALSTVISHQSAAVLHGLPVHQSHLDRVTVLRPDSNGQVTRLLHARRADVEPDEIVLVDGIPTTSVQRTVVDIARALPFGAALGVADAALRAGLDPESIRAEGRGRSRIDRVRMHADKRAESLGESVSRSIFIRYGIPMPTLQFVVCRADGTAVARSDFCWEAVDLIGEFDGDIKYSGTLPGAASPTKAIRAEKNRENEIRDCGYDYTHWGWVDFENPERLAARLKRALERARRASAA